MAACLKRLSALLAALLIVNILQAQTAGTANGMPNAGPSSRENMEAGSSRAIGTVTPVISPTDDSLYAVDWDPATGSALLAGANGTVLSYNATSGFRQMQQDQNFTFRHIAFRPLTVRPWHC